MTTVLCFVVWYLLGLPGYYMIRHEYKKDFPWTNHSRIMCNSCALIFGLLFTIGAIVIFLINLLDIDQTKTWLDKESKW